MLATQLAQEPALLAATQATQATTVTPLSLVPSQAAGADSSPTPTPTTAHTPTTALTVLELAVSSAQELQVLFPTGGFANQVDSAFGQNPNSVETSTTGHILPGQQPTSADQGQHTFLRDNNPVYRGAV
jgi:hypothetical protein